MSKVSMAVVASMALLAGGCTPQMKKAGYVAGGTLMVAGTAARLNAQYIGWGIGDDWDDLGLLLGEYYLGTAAAITGAFILLAALEPHSAPDAPPAVTAPAPRVVTPPAPAPAPSPTTSSPSAPSGSPLAPASSGTLSMRGGSTLAFH